LSKTNLTEEEKTKIIDALNLDTEPSAELMEKLFPSLVWATIEREPKVTEVVPCKLR
jgi:hypothetical protein